MTGRTIHYATNTGPGMFRSDCGKDVDATETASNPDAVTCPECADMVAAYDRLRARRDPVLTVALVRAVAALGTGAAAPTVIDNSISISEPSP